MKSNTPRTDEQELKLKSRGNWHGEIAIVGSDFARTLELELNQLRNEKELARKQGVIDGIKKAAEVVSNTPLGYVTERDHEVTEVYSDRCEAALLTLATKIESGEVEIL